MPEMYGNRSFNGDFLLAAPAATEASLRHQDKACAAGSPDTTRTVT